MNTDILKKMKQGSLLKGFLVFICVFLYLPVLIAQKLPKEIITREIILNTPDSLIKFTIITKHVSKRTESILYYYWFGSEMIHVNRGGYTGNLLQGKYLVFDKKMGLRNEGEFLEGLKHGVWKLWYESGELKSVINWKNGLKEGRAYFYDNTGKLQKVSIYKKDMLNGITILYRANTTEKIKYKDGKEIKKAPKVPRLKKSPETKNAKDSILRNDTKPPKSKKIVDKNQSLKMDKKLKPSSDLPTGNKVLQDSTSKRDNFLKRIFRKKINQKGTESKKENEDNKKDKS